MKDLLQEINRLGKEGKDIEMLPLLEEALDKSKKIGDKNLIIQILNDYAGVERVTGDTSRAEKLLLESKKIYEYNYPKDTLAYATILLNLATNYSEMGELDRALELLYDGISICEKLGERGLIYSSFCNNIAVVNIKNKNYRQALDYQLKNLQILCENEESVVKICISIMNLADIYMGLEDGSKALLLLKLSKEVISKKLGASHPIYSNILNNLSRVNYQMGNTEEALKLLEESREILVKTQGKESNNYKRVISNIDYIERKSIGKVYINIDKLSPGQINSYNLYINYIKSLIESEYSRYSNGVTIGLLGQGSEVLGYDDKLSEDHDFEPRLDIVLCPTIYDELKKDLKNRIPANKGKIMVHNRDDFFFNYTGCKNGPIEKEEWKKAPSHFLLNACNGLIFFTNDNNFTSIRERILSYYPNDIRFKKMASNLFQMGQAGQYNFVRSNKRKDYISSRLSIDIFVNQCINLLHHINKKYTPFYKWKARSLDNLEILGPDIHRKLELLISLDIRKEYKKQEALIEEISVSIVDYLSSEGLLSNKDYFLVNKAFEIEASVDDEVIKRESMWLYNEK